MRISLASISILASFLSLGIMTGTPAQAQLHNPCPYTSDGDCDEPNGLNLCAWGTDAVDCSNPNSNHGSGPGYFAGAYAGGGGGGGGGTSLHNPCPYTSDGDCDEPNGLNLCAWGTDAVDCSNPNSNYGSGPGFAAGGYAAPAPQPTLHNPCPYTSDGDCDEPNGLNLCAWGTDAVDCSNPNSNYGSGPGFAAGGYAAPAPQPNLYNPCPYTSDGDCDEPNGLNLCAWGTDAVDCSNPNSNYGSGPGFAAGGYAAPAPQPQQPVYGGGSTGSFVSSGGGGSYGCPNYSIQNTAFGEGTLTAGGALNPIRVPHITAGGRHALANCFPGTGWRGFTITRPDYRFFYHGQAPYGRLTFSLVSNATDTVLLINTPDGQWHFNDDSNGSYNSTLTFSPVLQGQYDIWAGSYNLSSNNAAQLWISEQ